MAAQHDWWLTAFVVLFALSLFANLCGVLWSCYRELCMRHLSDKLMNVANGAAKALSEIQHGLSDLCERISEDRGMRASAKEDIRREIEQTGQHIASMITMLVQSIRSGGVHVTNMNSDGQGQIGENSGGVHKHG